jgi:hypothetical protein
VAYLGQFDRLIRVEDRGKAVMNTRTIAVFTDALVVCAVSVYGETGKPASAMFGRARRTGRQRGREAGPGRGEERVRADAELAGSGAGLAETWPKAQLIPLEVIDAVVLTRPQQVSELTIYETTSDPASAAMSAFLGDLSADGVRATLGPILGDRLQIEIPG